MEIKIFSEVIIYIMDHKRTLFDFDGRILAETPSKALEFPRKWRFLRKKDKLKEDKKFVIVPLKIINFKHNNKD